MASRLTDDQIDPALAPVPAPAVAINAGLNLDGALPTSLEVDVTLDGETHHFDLKDDISSVVLMRGMDLDRYQSEVNAYIEAGDPEAAIASQTRYDSTVDFIFLAIFKASYPSVDAAFLRRAFDRMERIRLVMRFFDLRMKKPSSVSIAGDSTPTTPRETATPAAPASGKSKTKKLEQALGG